MTIAMGEIVDESKLNRRPIATRDAGWAQALAAKLARTAITPNQISVLSIAFAGIGAALLAWWPTPIGLIVCAICVQLRLLSNLLDGMVAVEGGKGSVMGSLYNEFPDRFTDSILLIALGYACGQPWLGWLCALLAVSTAYVRSFGGALGFAQDFRGPLAKAQRMAVLTLACIVGAVELFWHPQRYALLAAAGIIAIGSLLTCVTRTYAIVTKLRART